MDQEFQIYEPLPSLDRYKNLFLNDKNLSVLRTLQYELLARTPLKGKVLDFGGGKKAAYHHLINCESYDSVNIDPAMEPTWLTKVGEKLPSPPAQYDTVLSMNTLEHIFDARFVVEEIYGALAPGGTFISAVPFLFPVHAHPDDFFRPTVSWWNQALSSAGFKKISVTPLIWGPFSTGLTCSAMVGPLKRLRLHAALLMDLLYARIRFPGKTHYTEQVGRELQNYALGYFIKAEK